MNKIVGSSGLSAGVAGSTASSSIEASKEKGKTKMIYKKLKDKKDLLLIVPYLLLVIGVISGIVFLISISVTIIFLIFFLSTILSIVFLICHSYTVLTKNVRKRYFYIEMLRYGIIGLVNIFILKIYFPIDTNYFVFNIMLFALNILISLLRLWHSKRYIIK